MSDHPQGTHTWIDRVATLFDRAWQVGEHPRIEDYLEGIAEPRRSQLLEELLRVELHNRRAAGETPSSEDYVIRFPDNEAMIRAVVTGGAVRNVHPSSGDAASPPKLPLEDGGRYNADGPPASPALDSAVRSPEPKASDADRDATLLYSVAREGGKIEPLVSEGDLDQLARTFAPGMVLQGRYVLERELGRGAMGLVFLGRDNRLDRPVAIKAILPGESGWRARGSATEKQFQDRFLQEAKIGANLTHPAIATVHDFGYHGETPFTVFEYVAGPTLYDVIKRRGASPAGGGPADHRAARPGARLRPLSVRGSPRPEAGEHQGDRAGPFQDPRPRPGHRVSPPGRLGGFCGTPAYASPEQASGLPRDGRTDQYALALIAYELLTGRRPFLSRNVWELLEMQRSQEPPSLRRWYQRFRSPSSRPSSRGSARSPPIDS